MDDQRAPDESQELNRFAGSDVRSVPELDAYLASFRLAQWWLSQFNDSERKYIRSNAAASAWSWSWSLGDEESRQYRIASDVLCEIAGLFRSPIDRDIARRFFDKAEEVAADDPLDLHYTYTQMIRYYYRDRPEDVATQNLAIEACQKQIAIAERTRTAYIKLFPTEPLTGHPGFEQLAIIRERQGQYHEAIQLCQQALAQGWAGDWEWRIRRCQSKLEVVQRARA